ncbi:MAG: HEAT repeat domain-containing protein [Aggregatilineales bacterium]
MYQSDPDPNMRQAAWRLLEGFERYPNGVKVLVEMSQNDPDPAMRQFALSRLGVLGISAPDQHQAEQKSSNIRVYDQSELLNQSLYFFSPHNSQAYLSGRKAFFIPVDWASINVNHEDTYQSEMLGVSEQPASRRRKCHPALWH